MLRRIALSTILAGLLGGCSDPNPSDPLCGNGYVEAGEECDNGAGNGETDCSDLCTFRGCGDGVLQPEEECDLGAQNVDDGACTSTCRLASCGDGLVHAGVEGCDEGAANKDAGDGDGGCSKVCQPLSTCGDGLVEDGETCDDGNREDGDGCPSTCLYPFCGNGVVEDGETCDDGNKADDDPCPSTCKPAVCGDAFVHQGVEECDDGNDANDDACLTACLKARCGDGVVQTGVEECDDGNDDPEDGCNNECVRDRLVFVTDEPMTPNKFGSLFAADSVCRLTAKNFGHPNFESFRAWLSDDEESPATRFVHAQGRYVLVTGEVVAESWDDLTDGELAHGIDRTIAGALHFEKAVWTGTQASGEATVDSVDCESWTSIAPQDLGRQGVSGYTDAIWTDFDSVFCAVEAFLYCFEQ